MSITIIVKDKHGKQVEKSVELDNDMNWEEKCYKMGCPDSHVRGHLPALVGPHASRNWVTVLRNLTAN